MSRCDFENSQISAQDTVGVAGDDLMFHILVQMLGPSHLNWPWIRKGGMWWVAVSIGVIYVYFPMYLAGHI